MLCVKSVLTGDVLVLSCLIRVCTV